MPCTGGEETSSPVPVATVQGRYFYLCFFKLSVDNVVIFRVVAGRQRTSLLLRMLLLRAISISFWKPAPVPAFSLR